MQILWNAMVDSGKPTCPRHWAARRIGDRNQAHIVEFPEKGVEIGNIQPPMERGNSGNLEAPNLRERQIVEMKVHDVVFICLLRNGFNEIEVMSQGRKQLSAIQAKRPFANGTQAR